MLAVLTEERRTVDHQRLLLTKIYLDHVHSTLPKEPGTILMTMCVKPRGFLKRNCVTVIA